MKLSEIIREEMSHLKPLPEGFEERLRKRMETIMKENQREEHTEIKMKTKNRERQVEKQKVEKQKSGREFNVFFLEIIKSKLFWAMMIPVCLVMILTSPYLPGNLFMASSKDGGNQASNPAGAYGTEIASPGERGATDLSMESKDISNSFSGSSFDSAAAAPSDALRNPQIPAAEKQKKRIEQYHLSLETDQFDHAKKMLESFAEKSGGFVSSFEVQGGNRSEKSRFRRYASMTVKIPVDVSGEYLEHLRSVGNVISESKTVDDITKAYGDLQLEIRNLEKAEQRYLELFQKADTVEDMLLVENELGRLRGQIDIKKATLENYNYQSSYSTFYVSLNEVMEVNPVVNVEPGMWGRAKDGFVRMLNEMIRVGQDLVVFLISVLPLLAAVLVLFGIMIVIFRAAVRKKRDNSPKTGEIHEIPEFTREDEAEETEKTDEPENTEESEEIDEPRI